MQVALEIRAITQMLASRTNRPLKLKDFEIEFGQSQPAATGPQTREQAAQWAKAEWRAWLGGNIEGM